MSAFFRVAGNPRFETIHTLDVIGLMTAGAGIAVALILLIQFFSTTARVQSTQAGRRFLWDFAAWALRR